MKRLLPILTISFFTGCNNNLPGKFEHRIIIQSIELHNKNFFKKARLPVADTGYYPGNDSALTYKRYMQYCADNNINYMDGLKTLE